MVIVDERNFIEKALQEQGLDLFDFYDNHQLFTIQELAALPLQRRADVLLVDTQSLLQHPDLLEKAQAAMNTFLAVIFLHQEQDSEAIRWVDEQASFLKKIVGACALPMSSLDWTMLGNQLQFYWNMIQEQRMLQKHMVEFSQELDMALQTAQSEMAKAKKLHEVLVPKRNDEIKGVRFYNKYATGEGGGGEFYDLHQTPNKVFQVLVATESYLISSSLMGILNAHRTKDFEPAAFLKDAQEDIDAINSSKKKKARVDLLVLELDLTNLRLISHGDHKAEFYSQTNGPVSLAKGESYSLGKGEKFIVFSPGFLFNWKEVSKKHDIQSFLDNHRSLAPQDLMTELFFQIRQDNQSQFLTKDAMVVMMEVQRHGMHQV